MARCRQCNSFGLQSSMTDGLCAACQLNEVIRNDRERANKRQASMVATPQPSPTKILLTTETAPNLPIAERLEIITAECVLGMNMFKDVSSLFRDVVGGRSQAYQAELREARRTVLTELKREAFEVGADAVVAVTLNYSEISGGGKSMLFLVAAGTAVTLERPTSLG